MVETLANQLDNDIIDQLHPDYYPTEYYLPPNHVGTTTLLPVDPTTYNVHQH